MHKNQNIALNNIKGILFDVDGTLYCQTPLRMVMVILLLLSNFYKPKELLRTFKVIIQFRRSQEQMRSLEKVEQCNKNQILNTAQATGESPSYIKDIVEEWFEKRPLSFIYLCRRRGMKGAIEKWFKEGIKLGIYSDYPVDNKLHALGISELIDTRVSSSDPDVHGFKPNSNGFTLAARKMGMDPSEILYVGDREEVDGVGASNAGMQVIILKSNFKKKTNSNYAYVRSFHDLMKIV